MSDNSKKEKKYYWLKLKDTFFQQKEIKKLRKIAGGDTYTIIYLKLQLLSLKNNNKLFFDGFEDNIIEELSLEIDEDKANIEVVFSYLSKYNLIEKVSDFEYQLTNVEVGTETAAAERMRRMRDRNKQEQLPNKEIKQLENVTELRKSVTKFDDVTTPLRHIDLEKEIYIEKELYTKMTSDQQKYISILKEIENYPIDIKKDIKLYNDLEKEYQSIDLLEMIKDYKYYKLDNPFDMSKKFNARLQIRTQCKKCIEWNKCLKKDDKGTPVKSTFTSKINYD